MKKREHLTINSAGRNALWNVPVLVPSRFPGGETITEYKKIYDEPDWSTLTDAEDLSVELYGGLMTLKYDSADKRISPSRFLWVRYDTRSDAFEEFKKLW